MQTEKESAQLHIFVIEPCENGVEPVLYAYLFRSERFNNAVMKQLKGAQLPRVGWSSFAEIQIPLPPLEVQKEIVAEIGGYKANIEGLKNAITEEEKKIQSAVCRMWGKI